MKSHVSSVTGASPVHGNMQGIVLADNYIILFKRGTNFMARERVVTRAIVANNYSVMCVALPAGTIENHVFTLTGDIPANNEKALKVLKKNYETDTLKLVTISSVTTEEKIFGMTEVDFLKYAKEMTAERKFK